MRIEVTIARTTAMPAGALDALAGAQIQPESGCCGAGRGR
jgi:hypothetical protein